MNQSTADKFAAILKAAQDKAAAKTAPKAITAPAVKLPVNKDPEKVRTFDNIQDITAAAENGEVISILNLYNIVNDKPQPKPEPIQDNTPELSEFTFDDIMNEPAQEEQNSPASPLILAPCLMQWTKAGQPTTAPEIIAAHTPDKLAGFKTLKIGKFTFVEYSEKSFAIVADENTKEQKEKFYQLGGKFNAYLKCGKGFIFPIKKYYTVKTFIEKL